MTVCCCSAQLSPAAWVGHQQRYHSAKPGYACSDCNFASQTFPDIVTHCGLEGHTIDAVTIPSSASIANKFSTATLLKTEMSSGGNSPEPVSGPVKSELKLEEDPESSEAEEEPEEEQEEVEEEAEDSTNLPPKANSGPKAAPPKAENTRQKAVLQSCQKCGKCLKWPKSQNRARAASHVRACLDIRQFACSLCQKLSSRANDLQRHITKLCPGASVVEVEKERCQAALREGLRLCFPELSNMVGNGKNGPRKEREEEMDLTLVSSDPDGTNEKEKVEAELSEEEEPEEESLEIEMTPTMLERRSSQEMDEVGQLPQTITCSNCDTVMTRFSNSIAVQHVRSCTDIRPFSCSACQMQCTQAGNLRTHIRKCCPGAKVEMVDRDKCQSELREGLRRCFPGINFKHREK